MRERLARQSNLATWQLPFLIPSAQSVNAGIMCPNVLSLFYASEGSGRQEDENCGTETGNLVLRH
jgi:hypothetical protein